MRTFLDLYGADLDIELGTSDRTELFTTARRKQAINDAQEWFAGETGMLVRLLSVALSDDTQEVDLTASITDDDYIRVSEQGPYIQVTDANGNVTTIGGHEFLRTSVEQLDIDSPGWRNVTKATPSQWYERIEGAHDYFGLVPRIAIPSGSAALKVPYVARPEDMTDETDLPFRIVGASATSTNMKWSRWCDALVKKAAAYLEPLRKNTEAAAMRDQEAAARVLAYKDAQRVTGGRRVAMSVNYRRMHARGPRTARETVTI